MASIGKIITDFPPAEGNPRNSEGDFIRLSDGRILFVYCKFVGDTAHDSAPAYIAACTSSDNGDSFGDERIILKSEEYGVKNIMSVSLLPMRDGSIGLFFLVRRNAIDMMVHLSRSYDDGRTFSKAECCTPAFGYFVINNDRVIRLKNNRIIVPVAQHRMRGSNINDMNHVDYRSTSVFFYSDDDGKTFREAKTCCYPPNPASNSGLQEPGVIELENGALWAYFRTDLGCHYQSWSHDGGDTWSIPTASNFTGPCSPLSCKRLLDGRILAVWNPVPLYQTRTGTNVSWGRSPLVAALSSDDGKSFSSPVTVEDGSDGGGYAYTAIFPLEDSVLLSYCAGNESDKSMLARLRIKKIMLDEL